MFRIAMSAALAIFVALIAGAPSLAQDNTTPPQNRIALVIGNSNYQSVTVLPNPANDAKAVSDFLTGAGFEVIKADDLTRDGMRRAVLDFAAKVAEKGVAAVALVYYAGHGLQIDGENFLVPVDAKIARESDVPLQALRLADVMNMLSDAPAKTRIVILDACRNNPFSDIKQVTGRGLAIVDAPTGSIVSYATAPGMTALDGSGDHSPFTAAFVETAKEPGLLIEQALKKVRLAVHKATDGQQTPWESSSLTVNFSFIPGGAVASNDTAGGRNAPDGNNNNVADNRNPSAGNNTAGNNSAGNSNVRDRNDPAGNNNPPAGNNAAGNNNKSASNDNAGNRLPLDNNAGAVPGGGRGGPNDNVIRPQNASFSPDKKTIDEWRRLIRSRPPIEAYDLVIEEDDLEAYEAFVEIYPIPPFGPQVRSILSRRQEMVAWYQAFVLNNTSGFEAFIARFPDSDLAATARKLLQRARQRSVSDNAAAGFAAANLGSAACSCSQPNQGSQPVRPQPIRTTPPNATPIPQPPDSAFDNPPAGGPPDAGAVPPIVLPPVWGGVPPVWIVPPRDDGHYPPYDGHRPPDGGRHPPGDVRYPPNDGHRPPDGGRHPPGDGRYPPGGHRPPTDGKRPPKDASIPPGGEHRGPGVRRPGHRDDVRPPRRDIRPPRQTKLPPNIRQRPPQREVDPPRRTRAPRDFDRRRSSIGRQPERFDGPPPDARRVRPGFGGPPPGARRVGPGNGPPPGYRGSPGGYRGPPQGYRGQPQGYRGPPRGASRQPPRGFGGRPPSGNFRAPVRRGPSCTFINGRRICR